MRVCFDVSPALQQSAGVGRYARALLTALCELPNPPALTLLHNGVYKPDQLPALAQGLPRTHVPLGNKLWRLWLSLKLPLRTTWSAALQQANVFHGTDMIAPALPIPTTITVHDLTAFLFPQHHSRMNRWYQKLFLPNMLRRANLIIADSHQTGYDVSRTFSVPADRIRVIHLGVDHTRFNPRDKQAAQQRVLATLGISAPYVLSVGTLEPRKNLVTLLQAFANMNTLPATLVLTGRKGWGDDAVSRQAQIPELQGRVVQTGFVPEAFLPDLYAGAEAFVYPSLYEGFGLPILEAMACGTPVITSNTSSMPEVAGAAALLVSPKNADELKNALQRVLTNNALRDALREAGLRQARAFTWQRTAQQTLQVYQEIFSYRQAAHQTA